MANEFLEGAGGFLGAFGESLFSGMDRNEQLKQQKQFQEDRLAIAKEGQFLKLLQTALGASQDPFGGTNINKAKKIVELLQPGLADDQKLRLDKILQSVAEQSSSVGNAPQTPLPQTPEQIPGQVPDIFGGLFNLFKGPNEEEKNKANKSFKQNPNKFLGP